MFFQNFPKVDNACFASFLSIKAAPPCLKLNDTLGIPFPNSIFETNFGWNLGPTLGSSTVFAFVQYESADVLDVRVGWEVWNYTDFRSGDVSLRCVNDR